MEHVARQPAGDPDPEHDVRVLAVEDHPAFRAALCDLIAAAPGFLLVGEASSGEEALSAVERLVPDLVLMDIVMPGMGGVAATQAILSGRPDIRVVLISVDEPALHPELGALHGVIYSRKQDLAPGYLVQLWERALTLRTSVANA